MGVARRIGLSRKLRDNDDQLALDEFREKVEKDMSTGTDAPVTSTPGNVYIRTGASAGVYYKASGTWTQVANVS